MKEGKAGAAKPQLLHHKHKSRAGWVTLEGQFIVSGSKCVRCSRAEDRMGCETRRGDLVIPVPF
jgi:hypothetical protein